MLYQEISSDVSRYQVISGDVTKYHMMMEENSMVYDSGVCHVRQKKQGHKTASIANCISQQCVALGQKRYTMNKP